MHSWSFLLALYQHWLQRCKSGLCVAACAYSLDTGADHIFWVLDWARADYVFVRADVSARIWICEYVCICVLASMCVCVCVSRGIRSQASPRGLRGPVTSKGCGARNASLPAKGEILFMWRGLAWQDQWLTPQPGAFTDCHHPGRFKSWTT